MFPLNASMGNGSTVRDWLGTAGVASSMCARRIEDMREGRVSDADAALALAIADAEQAVVELRAVRLHIHNVGRG